MVENRTQMTRTSCMDWEGFFKFDMTAHNFLPAHNMRIVIIFNKNIMVTVVGTYQNGYVKLDKEYISDAPVKVMITFLEEVQTQSETVLSLSDFSFAKSQENLANVKTCMSDEVIEERRTE